MRIAIAGAGNVGRAIAKELLEKEHQVILIEREPMLLRRVPFQGPNGYWPTHAKPQL